ncbi:MAG TPA: ribonuclease HII [Flavobacteriales bacterium]|nr:ribonuclease HII [Flavobacteriales bacterium]HIN40201.1 ribonuclease HII [Flavobacteriales bacterium]
MLKICHTANKIEAGCDEAGRGCLAGPVFAAAVILPVDFSNSLLNDSKKLSKKHRSLLRPIIENEAIAWSVAMVDNCEIDELNILKASITCMHRALNQLKKRPNLLLIDGNRFFSYNNMLHHCIIRGDGIYASIAAASVLAKTHRDEYMKNLHQEFPNYHWNQNMGYPTKKHRLALLEHGTTKHHRMSFKLLP